MGGLTNESCEDSGPPTGHPPKDEQGLNIVRYRRKSYKNLRRHKERFHKPRMARRHKASLGRNSNTNHPEFRIIRLIVTTHDQWLMLPLPQLR